MQKSYRLMKSEPSVFSFEDLKQRPASTDSPVTGAELGKVCELGGI